MRVILQNEDYSKRDKEIETLGFIKGCPECGTNLDLIIQENADYCERMSIWWYCPECKETNGYIV